MRFVGGAPIPNLQHPDSRVPLLKDRIERLPIVVGG